eukprot:8789470-Ditylum_brightwellii.AAC.1
MLLASNIPLEHLFDNNEFCGAWCKRKRDPVQLTKDKKLHEDRRKVYYRNKEKDAALYDLMKSAYATFQCKEVLMQSIHTYSAQLNKGMNVAVAKYAPKTKMLDIGVQNRGHHFFWTSVYCNLGLFVSITMEEYFNEKDACLLEKKLKAKTPEWRREKAK